jgi:hypothetical protein
MATWSNGIVSASEYMGREIEPGQRVEVLIREILKKKYIGEHM